MDKESIGELAYYSPGDTKNEFPGIPNYYYPYKNQDGYQTPFLFVKFNSPRRNTLIQVECKAWAENIEADRTLRLGSVHFELQIDDVWSLTRDLFESSMSRNPSFSSIKLIERV